MNSSAHVRPYRRIQAGKPLGVRADACLALCRSPAQCRACERACPSNALGVHAEGFILRDACSGCGRCVAACPTGALRLESADMPTALACRAATVQVECARVPAAQSSVAAVRVPCTEGLAVSQWLELALLADGRPIEVLDRGWCAACEAGGAARGAGSLEAADEILEGLGVAAAARPRRRSQPLPLPVAQAMAKATPRPPDGAAVTRRGFFGGFAHSLGATVAEASQAAAPPVPLRRTKPGGLAAPERARRLELAERLARRMGGRIPGTLFPALRASAACRDDRMCVAVCPTGALRAHEGEASAGIDFIAGACISCGACTRACTARALEFRPRAAREPAPAVARLTDHPLAECPACGARSTQGAGGCRACLTAQALARDAFDTLFGEAAPAPANP